MPVIGQYQSKVMPPQGRETVPSNMAGVASAPAEAVARLGSALTDFGSQVLNQISQAEDTMEIAKLRGDLGDRKNALFNVLATTPDQTVREQLYSQAKQESETLTSKRPNVRRAFDAEKKLALVDWQADFNTVNNRLRVQNVQDQYQLNYDRLLEQGDVSGALKLSETAYENLVISQKGHNRNIETAPNESVLRRMDKAAQEAKFELVSTLGGQLKDPSADQLKRKNTILKALEQMQGDAGDAFQKAILKEAIDADAAKIDPLARQDLATDMKKRATTPDNGLTGEQARVLINWIDNWSAPGDVKTDWPTFQKIRQLVGPVARGEIKFNDARRTFYEESPKLAAQEQKELLEKLIVASEEKAKSPDKDPIFVRGMNTLNDFETRKLLGPADNEAVKKLLTPDQYENYGNLSSIGKQLYRENLSAKKLYELQNAYEQWYKEHPKATIEEHEKWISDILKLPKEQAVKNRLTEWINATARLVPWAKPQVQVGPLQIYLHTAINPKTGERMGTYDDKQWEKIP